MKNLNRPLLYPASSSVNSVKRVMSAYTGLSGTKMFELVFSSLNTKAQWMPYWKGTKQILLELHSSDIVVDIYNRPGPSMMLTLEEKFLMVMMRLRMGLLLEDIAFRFHVNSGLASSILQTWMHQMRKELAWLIIWPSKIATHKNLSNCFKKWYAEVQCIIHCTEVFIELCLLLIFSLNATLSTNTIQSSRFWWQLIQMA